MKRRLFSALCLVLALVMLLPASVVMASSSESPIENIEYASNGKIIGTGEGYYILEKDGTTSYIDEDGHILGEYWITVNTFIDLTPSEYVEIDEFFGVAVKSVRQNFADEWVENMTVFSYVVRFEDPFVQPSALAPWADNKNVLSYGMNGFTFSDEIKLYSKFDTNRDEAVDVFDFFLVKSICMETYEPTVEDKVRSDVNLDGVVDLFDYVEIKSSIFN